MTSCTNPEIGKLVAQFEFDMLPDDKYKSFSEHVMECDYCLSQLEQMAPIFGTMCESRHELLDKLDQVAASLQSHSIRSQISATKQNHGRDNGVLDWIMQWLVKWNKPQLWVPAGVIAIALIAFLWPSMIQSPNPYLSSLTFEKLPYNSSLMRSATSSTASFSQGIEAYERGDFHQAISSLKEAVHQNAHDETSQMFLGISYYLNRQAKYAIASLAVADTLTTGFLQLHVRWYMAQSYLLDNQPRAAVPFLQWVVDQDLSYAEPAKSLLLAIRTQGP